MSRNLGRRDCQRCGATPQLTGPTREITRHDAGQYFPEYTGMIVADATCPLCGARYMAWVSGVPGRRHVPVYDDEPPFCDLSYRSSFNDEPGDDDLPPWKGVTAQRAVELVSDFMKEYEGEFRGSDEPSHVVMARCGCAACQFFLKVSPASEAKIEDPPLPRLVQQIYRLRELAPIPVDRASVIEHCTRELYELACEGTGTDAAKAEAADVLAVAMHLCIIEGIDALDAVSMQVEKLRRRLDLVQTGKSWEQAKLLEQKEPP